MDVQKYVFGSLTTYPSPTWVVWPSLCQVDNVVRDSSRCIPCWQQSVCNVFCLFKENFILREIIGTKKTSNNSDLSENRQKPKGKKKSENASKDLSAIVSENIRKVKSNDNSFNTKKTIKINYSLNLIMQPYGCLKDTSLIILVKIQ